MVEDRVVKDRVEDQSLYNPGSAHRGLGHKDLYLYIIHETK